MDYISILQDSIDTSLNMKIFKNKEIALSAHIFKSKLSKIPMTKFNTDVKNFDTNRLQKSAVKAYPLDNRPRGNNDISSVKYYQKQLQQNHVITPIWILFLNNKYILLDGAHRIVASFIEKSKYINAYIIVP